MADWLGLKTFDFAIIRVQDLEDVVIGGRSQANVGAAFISRAERDSFTWGGDGQTLLGIDNLADLSSLVVLDTWIRNCDRHSPDGQRINLNNVFLKQVLHPQRKLELFAMDFTHAFTCGQAVDRRIGHLDRIRDEQVFGLFPLFRNHLSRPKVRELATRLQSFTREIAAETISRIPDEWAVETHVRSEWQKFLVERAHFLADHVESILLPPENLQLAYAGDPQ
jgi:hypothetical protein